MERILQALHQKKPISVNESVCQTNAETPVTVLKKEELVSLQRNSSHHPIVSQIREFDDGLEEEKDSSVS